MKTAIYALFMLVVGLLAAEIVAEGYVYVNEDTLTWMRRVPASQPTVPGPDQAVQATRQVLFPYYGFGLRPGWRLPDGDMGLQLRTMGLTSVPDYWRWPANNLGFQSDANYPRPSEPNDFVVAIFGGSVANGLALEGREELGAIIRSVPRLMDRNVVFVNLAQGGFKQPQQVLVLAYLLALGQKLDAIINLDRFNELYVAWENDHESRVSADMPAAKFIFGLQNRFLSTQSDVAAEVAQARSRARRLERRAATARSALHYLYLRALLLRAETRVVEIETEIGKSVPGRPYPIVLRTTTSESVDRLAIDVADIWYRASIAMKGLALSVGAVYVHVIQPNQYFSRRRFSETERAVAIDPSHAAAVLVPRGYPEMLKRGALLAESGIAFVDTTAAFDSKPRPVYFDTCCHFNKLGYSILIERYIRPKLLALLESR